MHIDDELDAQEEMASEEVTEETKTFQITGVTDGATGQMISFEEALKKVRVTRGLSSFTHTLHFAIENSQNGPKIHLYSSCKFHSAVRF